MLTHDAVLQQKTKFTITEIEDFKYVSFILD